MKPEELAAGILEALAQSLPEHVEKLAQAIVVRALEPVLARIDCVHELFRSHHDDCNARIAGALEELRRGVATAIAAGLADLPPPVQGTPGERGEPGPPGRDGRDATMTAPVPYVPGRVFARGSLVLHRGGVWYANADSEVEPGAPHSGYALVLDAVTPLEVVADERGYLTLVLEHASGVRRSLPLGFRPLTYQDVYDVDRDYEPNDAVTINGSVYIARAPSRGVRPGIAEAQGFWTLAVKAGKPARANGGGHA